MGNDDLKATFKGLSPLEVLNSQQRGSVFLCSQPCPFAIIVNSVAPSYTDVYCPSRVDLVAYVTFRLLS